MRPWLAYAAAAAALVGGGDLATVQEDSRFVEIDGSKNPQDIPEWVAWETGFSMLALAHSKGSLAVPASLGLSGGEADLVFREAAAQLTRDSACQKRVERLRPLLGREKIDVINEKTKTIQLDCRWKTLEARDRLLAALSPEGQTSLLKWVSDRKSGIHVRVPKAELDHYRRPQ
jgi:hypothetical protein